MLSFSLLVKLWLVAWVVPKALDAAVDAGLERASLAAPPRARSATALVPEPLPSSLHVVKSAISTYEHVRDSAVQVVVQQAAALVATVLRAVHKEAYPVVAAAAAHAVAVVRRVHESAANAYVALLVVLLLGIAQKLLERWNRAYIKAD